MAAGRYHPYPRWDAYLPCRLVFNPDFAFEKRWDCIINPDFAGEKSF